MLAMRRSAQLLVFLLVLGSFARADAGLMLGESTGMGMSRWTSAGHSAVYLSRVCPDGPVHLRLCAPGEQGSVLSNYINFNEDKPYEWNVIPLSVFLYGVENAKDRPLYASPALREALQENFRAKHLSEICPEGPCSTDPKAHWRDLVGANFARDIYMFEVKTTREQDEAFIAKFNALPNIDHYNGFTRNCADFARLVINTYFPDAARPDHLNDFWMTSPKAISKSFTHYAVKHPELQFRVVRFTQIPGTYRPSSDARKGTELVFTSKKWFFPMLLRSNELMMFTASYAITGRFNPERELRRRPSAEVSEAMIREKSARGRGDPETLLDSVNLIVRSRKAQFGSRDQWDEYEAELADLRQETNQDEFGERPLTVKELANDFDTRGSVLLDPDGAIWVLLREGSATRRIGVSASNVNAPGSDPDLAFTLLAGRATAELHSPPKNREMLPEFEACWRLLVDAHRKLVSRVLVAEEIENSALTTFASH